MKKLFLLICIIFSFTACRTLEYVEPLNNPQPIRSSSEKTVVISGFPNSFESDIEYLLENYGWQVAVTSPNKTDSFSVVCHSLGYRDFHGYEGVIKFTDLRTGKRIAYYEFSSANFKDVVVKVVEIMQSIPGA